MAQSQADFQGFTQPAPTSGLNVVGAIDNMDPSFALELVNIFPSAQAPVLRKGYTSFASITGDTTPISTLNALALASSELLIGTNNTKIIKYALGSSTDITGSTTPTNSNWNCDTFGYKLYLCNGIDNAQVTDGTTTTDINFTGVTLSNLINVSSYEEIIYFVEKNSLKFWYGPTQDGGTGAALIGYDLKWAFKNGGFLVFAGSWTNQIASTSQDLFFACSSEGEILFYRGLSPTDTDTPWGKVAKFAKIGKPLSYRSFIRVNNDVWIITEQGIVPISALFAPDPAMAIETVSKQINPIIASYASTIGFNHIWHGAFWPQGRRVYIVIPTSGNTSILAVYGIDSQGWTTYELYSSGDCISLAVKDELPYFGSNNGIVFSGETGYNDNDNAISFNGRTAFSFFGNRGTYKAFKDIRPLMKTTTGLTMQLGLDTNFQRSSTLDTITTSTGTFTPYGSLYGSLYSSDVSYIFDRHAVRGQGHSAAIRFAGSIKDSPLELYGFEIRFNQGIQV